MPIYGVKVYLKPLKKRKLWKRVLIGIIVFACLYLAVNRFFAAWDHDYEMMNEGVAYYEIM